MFQIRKYENSKFVICNSTKPITKTTSTLHKKEQKQILMVMLTHQKPTETFSGRILENSLENAFIASFIYAFIQSFYQSILSPLCPINPCFPPSYKYLIFLHQIRFDCHHRQIHSLFPLTHVII